MPKTPTAREKLAARIARLTTAKLIELHGETLAHYYKVPLAEAEPLSIVIDALVAEMERRNVEFNLCCYCPAPHHDERTCDRTAPAKLIEAADVIMRELDHAR